MLRKISLLLLLSFAVVTVAFAQTREDEASEDLDYYQGNNRQQRNTNGGDIWYGAGAQLGFQGGNNQSFFQIGLSPIVGYKLNNFLSVGPRASINYNSFRFDPGFGAPEQKNRFFTWSAGLFARARVFRGFFAHAEYSLVSDVDVFTDGSENRVTRALPFLGGGLSQGGGPGAAGFEILVLFRLTQPDRLNDSPFEFRTGFNYNF